MQINNQEAKLRLEKYQKTGSMQDLAEFYQPFMEMVYAVGLRYFKQPDLAENLVMDVFETLHIKLKTHQINQVSAWIYTLAKNECLMTLRKKKHIIPLEPNNCKERFVENQEFLHLFHEKEKNLDALYSCLSELKESQKICIELFYLKNKSYQEISELHGFTLKEVKSFIQNGKRNLKNCIEKKDERT